MSMQKEFDILLPEGMVEPLVVLLVPCQTGGGVDVCKDVGGEAGGYDKFHIKK